MTVTPDQYQRAAEEWAEAKRDADLFRAVIGRNAPYEPKITLDGNRVNLGPGMTEVWPTSIGRLVNTLAADRVRAATTTLLHEAAVQAAERERNARDRFFALLVESAKGGGA